MSCPKCHNTNTVRISIAGGQRSPSLNSAPYDVIKRFKCLDCYHKWVKKVRTRI